MSVTIVKDTATPEVQRIWDLIAPGRRKPLMTVLGREAERVHRAWFRTREADSPNKQGWPRQHFWARIRTATAFDPSRTTDDRAVVTVSDPALGAKVHGGTWGAKESKNLAISLRPEVYGVRPRASTIPGLFFLPSLRGGNTVGWLATHGNPQTGAQGITAWWRLQRRVTVPADPRALPQPADVGTALAARAQSFFVRRG